MLPDYNTSAKEYPSLYVKRRGRGDKHRHGPPTSKQNKATGRHDGESRCSRHTRRLPYSHSRKMKVL